MDRADSGANYLIVIIVLDPAMNVTAAVVSSTVVPIFMRNTKYRTRKVVITLLMSMFTKNKSKSCRQG